MSSTTTEVPLCWTNHSRIFGWDPDPNQPYQCRKAYAKVDEMDLDECKKSCITNFYNNPDKGCNAIDYGHADRQCAILHCSKPIVPTIYREGWNGYVWDPYQGWNGKKIITEKILFGIHCFQNNLFYFLANLIYYDNSMKKRASRASALRADGTPHIRGLVLTPGTSPTPWT